MHAKFCLEWTLIASGTAEATAVFKFLPRTTFCTHEIAKPWIDRLSEVLVASDVVAAYHFSDTCKHRYIKSYVI
jgi:hypothetical protein